mgnify:CR=1 FL=1|jgi:spore germination cell wall hydrolase CwlJ-like protein|tara:strand:- start:2092 stop:2598 length:507 start_codon:yes stop_codon:yes gene_type:complete
MKYLLSFIILFGTHVSVQASGESEDTFCLAQNIYFEAGNQPVAGKMAVAEVVYNRVAMAAYPDTVCGVIYDAKLKVNWKGDTVPVINMCQFSWYCDGKSDMPTDSKTWNIAYRIAQAYSDKTLYWNSQQQEAWDLTEGSTHYHADSVHPYWADSLNKTVTIDNHIFYK